MKNRKTNGRYQVLLYRATTTDENKEEKDKQTWTHTNSCKKSIIHT